MSVSVVIVGLVFLIYSVVIFLKSNFTLGILFTMCLAVWILLFGFFKDRIDAVTSKGFWKYVKIFVIVLLCGQFALVCFLAFYGQNDNVDYSEDAVIVLGAGIHGDRVSLPLKYRLDKAIEYHLKNPDAVIVVSGGMGYQETVTEAYAMKKYLVEHGVNENVIVKEEKATSTIENMKYSKEILDKEFQGNYETVVITNDFHVYRGVYYAKTSGYKNVGHMGAPIRWYNYIPCYLRESFAVLKMFVFD